MRSGPFHSVPKIPALAIRLLVKQMKLSMKGAVLVILVLAAAAVSISAVAAAGDQDQTRDCLGTQQRIQDRLMDGSCGACPGDGTCDGDGLKATYQYQGLRT